MFDEELVRLITFGHSDSDSDLNWIQATICELPWVTSISLDWFGRLPAIHHDPLFIRSTNNDLITFAEEIRPKLDSFTYIFTDTDSYDMYSGPVRLGNNARVLISFFAPTSGQSLILRLKHSGKESSLTIDDITLYPIPGPSESDHLSFEPGIRNDIAIQFRGTVKNYRHFLHDIELVDEAGKQYYGIGVQPLKLLNFPLVSQGQDARPFR
ncbi:hypothetical protein BYT27DRAFT_7339823 [Phlegmacium glaucopus]|nr:hypothetical protein BYT27DRAFT_7339823 [Phlegmacium glaucopus]